MWRMKPIFTAVMMSTENMTIFLTQILSELGERGRCCNERDILFMRES